MRRLIASGVDPGVERKKEKRAKRMAAANTFEALGREWFETQKPAWSKSYTSATLARLEKQLFPTLGARPIAEIEPPELLDTIRSIERRGALEIAAKSLVTAGQVFRYAIQVGKAQRDPPRDLRGALQIGMAQAMQAIAAKATPHTDMNPILLKPKGDCISQVVLQGRPYKDIHITEYYKETPVLLAKALVSYQRLEPKFGQIVVEGAGGAAELNLYDRDIANTLLAQKLRIPIILVADIERGGVFAQIYGTIELLPEDIRSLVKGSIINKFRGDPSIFEPGVKKIEELTGIPVLGVVPFFTIPLPSEHSLSIGDKKTKNGQEHQLSGF